ncbi:MAG: lipoyl synthase, partial [Oscillospiraceae bacterium]|nr:lipoyl synthase [Oscillospiraceae bacterium]
ELELNTVCQEANCPNRSECFSKSTATFLILGTNCTRKCAFCNVNHASALPIDNTEPERIAAAVKKLGMQYVVITSVTRDDLPDGGAKQFAKVITAIQNTSPETKIETLIPDFNGDINAIKTVTDAKPTVISHNIETVASLYTEIRPQADYKRSLTVLKNIKALNNDILTKSGIMLGLGENRTQVVKTLDDLHKAGCDYLTIGQYLSPTKDHYPVKEYIEPDIFTEYAIIAQAKGFRDTVSAPLVRSSYNANKARKSMINC